MEKCYRTIEDNIKRIRHEMAEAALAAGRDPAAVRLMAVTKTQSAETVNAAIACGIGLLGENRAQELCEKFPDYHKDGVEIHFIGHLQTNKVKQIADKVTMIHSVHSAKLAAEIHKQCERLDREMQVLIEVNIAGESSKSGIPPEAVEDLAREIAALPRLRLRGLMTIPPVCDKIQEAEGHFSRMNQLYVDIMGKNIDNVRMDCLSMGMSGDFKAAIKHGATIVRVGSALFGARVYP